MSKYEIPVWKMCEDASKNLPEVFSPIDVIKEIHKKYPNVKSNTIRCHVIGCTPNHPSYKHYSINRNFFKYLGNGKFCLVDKEIEGLEIVQESEENEEESMVFSYEFEADLKYHIASNLRDLEEGLELYNDNKGNGLEYQTEVGRIDILAVDKNKNFVVIELKAGMAADKVCGQVQRYMGWIKKHLAKDKSVRGMIIAREISEKLKYAASVAPNIEIKTYQVNFTFNNEDLE